MIKSFKVLSFAVVAGLCASSAASALETPNGIISNGIISNGIISNGIISNGIISNGIISNGIIRNGSNLNGSSSQDEAQATAVILKDGARVTLK